MELLLLELSFSRTALIKCAVIFKNYAVNMWLLKNILKINFILSLELIFAFKEMFWQVIFK